MLVVDFDSVFCKVASFPLLQSGIFTFIQA